MMDNQLNPLDEIALPAKTYREILTEILKDDWNMRKTVMRASDTTELTAGWSITIKVPMAVAKQVLDELPPMQ